MSSKVRSVAAWFWVLGILSVFAGILTIVLMYRMSTQSRPVSAAIAPTQPPPPNEFAWQEEAFQDSAREIVYVYSSACGWCDRFNPVWDDFSNRYEGPLRLVKVEARDPAAMKYQVTRYPTVLFMANGVQQDVFDSERTVENLLRFARKNE